MSSPSETCASCKTPMVLGHLLSLDSNRISWRLCCLCAAELIDKLSDSRTAASENG